MNRNTYSQRSSTCFQIHPDTCLKEGGGKSEIGKTPDYRASQAKIICVKLRLFSYLTVLTCVLGSQKNCLFETVLLSTHNICFG